MFPSFCRKDSLWQHRLFSRTFLRTRQATYGAWIAPRCSSRAAAAPVTHGLRKRPALSVSALELQMSRSTNTGVILTGNIVYSVGDDDAREKEMKIVAGLHKHGVRPLTGESLSGRGMNRQRVAMFASGPSRGRCRHCGCCCSRRWFA